MLLIGGFAMLDTCGVIMCARESDIPLEAIAGGGGWLCDYGGEIGIQRVLAPI